MKAKLYCCPCGRIRCRTGWRRASINWEKLADYLINHGNIVLEMVALVCDECWLAKPVQPANLVDKGTSPQLAT